MWLEGDHVHTATRECREKGPVVGANIDERARPSELVTRENLVLIQPDSRLDHPFPRSTPST
jgi:hypothetical protein